MDTVGGTENHPRKTLPKGMKPWKPGQSGNPKGRPKKGKIIGEAMREVLLGKEVSMTLVDGKGRKTEFKITADRNFAYGIAAITLREAMRGNIKAVRELADRVDGKPHQSMSLEPPPERETPVSDEILAELADKIDAAKGASE